MHFVLGRNNSLSNHTEQYCKCIMQNVYKCTCMCLFSELCQNSVRLIPILNVSYKPRDCKNRVYVYAIENKSDLICFFKFDAF